MKRWLALAASIAMQTCLGGVYAWSTFAPALEREHGIHTGLSGTVFGVCIAVFTITMVLGGILQKWYGPRPVGMAGGQLFLAGYLVGSHSAGSFPVMITGFGILAGAGIGLGYVCPLATGVKWFPENRGMISGLTVAGFGIGGIFFAEAGQLMLDREMPVLNVLENIGWIAGVIVVVSATLLFTPDVAAGHAVKKPVALSGFLKQKEFRMLFSMMFCGTFGGLLVIGNLKPIGMENGLTAAQATGAVMLFAVGNGVGRVVWGYFHDRYGIRTITWCMLLLMAGTLWMGFAHSMPGFLAATFIIAFAFGGFFVLFAAEVAADYGVERIGDIYPFFFLGYGIAGLAGPSVGGELLHLTHSTVAAIAVAVLVALAGAVISIQYKKKTGVECCSRHEFKGESATSAT